MATNGNGKSRVHTANLRVATNAGAKGYFTALSELIMRIPCHRIDEIAEVLIGAYQSRRHIFLFGNGGSASLASHFACDLSKGVTAGCDRADHVRALALTDNIAILTAWANDTAYEEIFACQLRNFVEPGDIAFAISGSGNSPNVLKALEYGRQVGAYCVGLTGFHGGRMRDLCDICLIVPSDNMQLIEDVHLSVAHSLYAIMRDRLQLQDARVEMATATT